MGILEGKKILVTGVLTDDSLAFSAARTAQLEGAEIVLTGFGRGLSLTTRTARKLPSPAEVIDLDISDPDRPHEVAREIRSSLGRLDGIVHAIAFAPETCLGHGMLAASWTDVATTIEISTYSLKVLSESFRDLLIESGGGSIVGLDFDASVSWPGYDWMGVAKAGLESLSRYLARELGPEKIRVNLVSAGPLRTIAAKSIPGFSRFEGVWSGRSPLGWDVSSDQSAVGLAVAALLSNYFPKTTGEIIHVDGGFHTTGA